jgi:predicted ATPase
LHARIAETLERDFPDIAENQPEILARHCTEAGLVDKAAAQWGSAAHRSLERSAMVEAVVQFTTARDLVATLPSTPKTRRQLIELQAALLAPLIGTKGFAAAETKTAIERAQALIEEVEALREPLDDHLVLLSVLYGFWTANLFGFNGKNLIEISHRIMAVAERKGTTYALMMGYRTLAVALMATGAFSEGRRHLDQAAALYNTGEHRQFATRFLHAQVANLSQRAMVLWQLGFPNATLSDLEEGREIGHAASVMGALFYASLLDIWCNGHSAERKLVEELLVLAEENRTPFFTAMGTMQRGVVLAVTGDAEATVPVIEAGISQYRSTNSTWLTPWYLTRLAEVQAKLGRGDEAWQRIFEAFEEMEKGGEVQRQAEVNRVAGEIALLSPEIDAAKAERYFEKALAVARQQQAKSWELRAAISMARLWRDQGKPQQARELLAPVYGWFTEGFNTRDLKEAKALLGELAS